MSNNRNQRCGAPSSKLQAPSAGLGDPTLRIQARRRKGSPLLRFLRSWVVPKALHVVMLVWWTFAPYLSRAEYQPAPGASPAWSQPPFWQGSEPEPEGGPSVTNSDYDQLPDWYEEHIGTDKFNPDTDGDQISDSDELSVTFTNPLQPDTDGNGWNDYEDWSGQSAPLADPDGDGLSNDQETLYSTNPRSTDTDGDGLADGWETASSGVYQPLLADTDGDGVGDYYEATSTLPPSEPPTVQGGTDVDNDGLTADQESVHGTDPNLADSDGDGLLDGSEVAAGSNPLMVDSDGDGLSDSQEQNLGTNPTNPDTDGDLLSDGLELSLQDYDPNSTDSDGDGISDYQEYTGEVPPPAPADGDSDGLADQDETALGTNPGVADSDGDGLSDGLEVTWGSHPLQTDTDQDGLTDAEEYQLQLDPNYQDTDSDTLADGYEVTVSSTLPGQADSDSDGLSDFDELFSLVPSTNPNSADTDGDGLSDQQEFNKATAFPLFRESLSPVLADTDGDGVQDGQEIADFMVDTDSAGVPDRVERLFGLDPHDPADEAGDLDGDGLSNLQEYQAGNSLNGDYSSEFDWDLDGMTNVWEAANGLDPNDYHDAANDPDADYIPNLYEFRNGTDPWTPDPAGPTETPSGEPFLTNDDGQEWNEDWDGDGTSNLSELLDSQTDPTDPESTPPPEDDPNTEEEPPGGEEYPPDDDGEGGEEPPGSGCPNGCGCSEESCDTSTCYNCYNPPPEDCFNACGCMNTSCDTTTCSSCQTTPPGCPNGCGCGDDYCDTSTCYNCYNPPPEDCSNACGCMNSSCDTTTCSGCAQQTCGCGCGMNLNECDGCDGHCQDPCSCWGQRHGQGCSCATSADCASCSSCQCGADGCDCTNSDTNCQGNPTQCAQCCTGPSCPGPANCSCNGDDTQPQCRACCNGPSCPGPDSCSCNGDDTQQQCRAMDGCFCNSDGSQCAECTYEGECSMPCDGPCCSGPACPGKASCSCNGDDTQPQCRGMDGCFCNSDGSQCAECTYEGECESPCENQDQGLSISGKDRIGVVKTNGAAKPQTYTVEVGDQGDPNSVTLESSDTTKAEVDTSSKTVDGTKVSFKVSGKKESDSEGDVTLTATLGDRSGTLKLTVVVPKKFGKTDPELPVEYPNSPCNARVNTPFTSPPANFSEEDMDKGYCAILTATWTAKIKMEVLDQFGTALGDLYNGAQVEEEFAQLGFRPINQNLMSGFYTDPVSVELIELNGQSVGGIMPPMPDFPPKDHTDDPSTNDYTQPAVDAHVQSLGLGDGGAIPLELTAQLTSPPKDATAAVRVDGFKLEPMPSRKVELKPNNTVRVFR